MLEDGQKIEEKHLHFLAGRFKAASSGCARLEFRALPQFVYCGKVRIGLKAERIGFGQSRGRTYFVVGQSGQPSQQVKEAGQFSAHRLQRAHRPKPGIDKFKNDQTQSDSDKAVTHHSELGVSPVALESAFVKSDANLIPAIGNARAAKVDVRRQRSDGTEWKPEPAQRIEMRKNVHQCNHPKETANNRASKSESPFLDAGSYGGKGTDNAGDDRCVNSLVSEHRENQVTDERSQRAFDRKVHVCGICERIRNKSATF